MPGRRPNASSLMVSCCFYEETPQRVEIVRVALQAAGLGTWYEPLDHGLAPIQAVHDPDFLDFLRTIYALAFLRALEH